MRLEVNRGDLLGVLQKVQSVISTRRFPPFSSGVLMKAKEEKICLQAFDSESYFKGYTDARIEGEGTFIVDTRKLYDIVKALPADTVSIEDKKDRIRITAGKSRFNILKLSIDFSFPEINEDTLVEVESEKLLQAIRKTAFAVSRADTANFVLTGFYIDGDRVVTTDGHRLTLIESGVDLVLPDGGAIVPYSGMMGLQRILDVGDAVKIGFSGRHMVVQHGSITVAMRLYDGAYPDYKQVIPSGEDGVNVVVERNSFLEALRRCSVFAGLRSDDKVLRLKITEGNINAHLVSSEFGEVVEDVHAEYTGPDTEIALNVSYLIDAFEAMDEGRVRLNIRDESSPIMLKPEDSNGYLCIIMPVRV